MITKSSYIPKDQSLSRTLGCSRNNDFKFLDIKKILFLPMGGIGNMLMLTPVIEKLHKVYPQAKILMVMPDDYSKEVLRYCPYVKVIIHSHPKTLALTFSSINLILTLRKENIDLCIIPYPSSGIRKVVLAKLAGCKLIISHPYLLRSFFGKKTTLFLDNVAIEKNQHDIDSNIDLIKTLGIEMQENEKKMILWNTKKHEEYADNFLKKNKIKKKLVGIHPGSGKVMFWKRWPMERYNQLIKYLTKKGYYIIVFLGPEEKFLMNNIYKNNRVFFSTNDIHDTAAIIKRCNFFVSNDSGLMHIAVSQDIPTIGIFGPTSDMRTGPYGNKHKIVKSNIPCMPCYDQHKDFKCKHLSCLKSIVLDDVKKAIGKIENEIK